MVNIDISSSEQSQGSVSTCDSLGTGSSRTWLLADSIRRSGKATTTAERHRRGHKEEEEGEVERRGRIGNSGRVLTIETEPESLRRDVHSCSGNTKIIGLIFTYDKRRTHDKGICYTMLMYMYM